MHKTKSVTRKGIYFRPKTIAQCVTLALATAAPAASFAFNLETGNPDLDLTWDNTIRYSGGWRAGKVSPTFYNDVSFDETEGRFKKGDMVTNRLDLLTEFEVVYLKSYGFRTSAAGWYDQAYDKQSDVNPLFNGVSGNYAGNNFNSYAKKYVRGPAGEFLDVFAFGKFELGDAQLNLKVGQHNVYWGDSLFSLGNSIAYSQGPVDTLKSATSPGAEAKELFMPLNQISAQLQVTPEISIGAQYLLDWKPFRLVPGGSFFSTGDGTRSDFASPPAAGFVTPSQFLGNGPDLEPEKHGDFGVNVRLTPNSFGGTIGVYYRRFDEKLPWAFIDTTYRGVPSGLGVSTVSAVRLNYARNTQLFGVSVNKSIASISVGSEISYRKDTALVSNTFLANPTGVPVSYEDAEGARGDTFHALVNGIYLLPETPLWVGGSMQFEVSYQNLRRITSHADRFKGEINGCTDKKAGCATKDSVGMNLSFTPEWPQAFPGWDLSMPTSLSYGINGNGAGMAGSNEGEVKWAIGVTGKLRAVYEFGLKYIDSYNRYLTTQRAAGSAVQNNHNWVALTFKTAF